MFMNKTILSLMALSSSLLAQTGNSGPPEANPLSGRWAALTTASVGFRFIGVTSDSRGVDPFNQAQHQEVLAGEFRFDKDAKYTLETVLASGAPFNAGWNNTGVGPADGSPRIYWKQFHLSAKPIQGVEFQYGGLGAAAGGFSDIIGYSFDGYVTGERLAIHRPNDLFFDTISATYGFLGDLDEPDMAGRFRRLHEVNFRQYLVSKRLAPGVEASVQYTNQWGVKTVHEGVSLSTSRLRAVDSLRAEFYERTNSGAASGFNVAAGKKISRRWNVEGGYASIDRSFGDLNSDAFIHGNRVYADSEFHIGRALSLFALVNHGVNNNYDLPNRTHVHCGFTYDLVKALQRSSKI
jgi:hypothetical protein